VTTRRLDPGPQPTDDVLVWTLVIPAGAIGAAAAIIDGYENAFQLRTYLGAPPGEHKAWVAPAFRRQAEELFADLSRRLGVRAVGPRPFGPGDLAAGTNLAAGADPP